MRLQAFSTTARLPFTQSRAQRLPSSGFTAALSQLKRDHNDYGLKRKTLTEGQNKLILATLTKLGFKNLDEKGMFYFDSALPYEYMQAMIDSDDLEEQEEGYELMETLGYGSRSTTSLADPRMLCFVDPVEVDHISHISGVARSKVHLMTAAHELTHKLTIGVSGAVDEMLCEYVSSKFVSDKEVFLTGITYPPDGGMIEELALKAIKSVLSSYGIEGAEKLLQDFSILGLYKNKSGQNKAVTIFDEFVRTKMKDIDKAPRSGTELIQKFATAYVKELTARAEVEGAWQNANS